MTPRETPKKPIACALSAGAYRERLAWIAQLNRSSLRSVRREGERLILAYDPQAGGDVREMVRREQECCAFLRFELSEGPEELTLAIAAPEEAKEALDALFEPFLKARADRPADPHAGCRNALT